MPHQLVVRDRVAVAEHHGGDLRVHQRRRDEAGRVPADFDVLAGGVKNLQNLLVRHQAEERREIDPFCQRIDHDRLLGRGELRHAEDRVVGRLALELGIDRHEGVTREPFAGFSEFLGLGNRLHVGGLDSAVGPLCQSHADQQSGGGKSPSPV
jgi:hypothetical protein